jgi:hypothetical protein
MRQYIISFFYEDGIQTTKPIKADNEHNAIELFIDQFSSYEGYNPMILTVKPINK